MWQKLSEGVVQGIAIAAVCFCAATIWTTFQSSTNDLNGAKAQLDSQITRNQELIDFNNAQERNISELTDLVSEQGENITKLAATVALLNGIVENLSPATDTDTETERLVATNLKDIEESRKAQLEIKNAVRSGQQQQQVLSENIQRKQTLQQQLQQQLGR